MAELGDYVGPGTAWIEEHGAVLNDLREKEILEEFAAAVGLRRRECPSYREGRFGEGHMAPGGRGQLRFPEQRHASSQDELPWANGTSWMQRRGLYRHT